MSKPALLVIESNPVVERQLTDILSGAGYELYGLDSVERLMRVLSQRPFPLVIIDVASAGVGAAELVRGLVTSFPNTAFIATGAGLSVDRVLAILRSGAVDYLAKPFDPAELTLRVESAMHPPTIALPMSTPEFDPAMSLPPGLPAFGDDPNAASGFPELEPPPEAEEVQFSTTSRRYLVEFLDHALQTFLELEKENHALTTRVHELENPAQAARRMRPLNVWVAHPDEEFCKGILSLGRRLHFDVKPPLATGGEVLDRMSSVQPDILILADMLADIPGMFVMETVTSEYRNVAVLTVSGWGGPGMAGELQGPGGSDTLNRNLGSVDDLIKLLEEAKTRCYDADLGKEFASKFKARHAAFIEQFNAVKQAVLGEE